MATSTPTPTPAPTLTTQLPTHWSLADVHHHLGSVPFERIRSLPPPGMATVDDVELIQAHEDRLCELIDGILVEKTAGWYEALLATLIASLLCRFVSKQNVGVVLGAGGALQLTPHQVRIPDACFISWSRFPKGFLPKAVPIPLLVPDLAIEVLSRSNTPREMERKREQYFQAGVRLVWYVDPETRSAVVYTSAEDAGTTFQQNEPLSGGEVLPGFTLSLAEIFQEADRSSGS